VTIEWKLFWTGIGACLALCVGLLGWFDVLWEPLAGVLVFAMAAAVTVLAWVIVDASEMWREAAAWKRKRAVIGIAVAAAAFTAWTITAVAVPRSWLVAVIMLVSLGLLAVGVYWSARALEWRFNSAVPPKPKEKVAKEEEEALLGEKEKVLQLALRRADRGFVQVAPMPVELRDHAGWQFRVRVPSRATVAKEKEARVGNAVLTQADMEPLAIALAEILKKDIESDWVRLRKERGAGIYTITVANRDIMAEVIEYKDDPTPASINDPALCGIEIDGREHKEPLNRHRRIVGGSTSGKSSLINVDIAFFTRCEDAVLWIGGVQKLYDLVGPWLECYHGTGLRPPIDWVAHGTADTLQMMASAMSVARWRQRQPMNARKWPTIILVLDEFSFVAQSTQRIRFDGEMVNAAWLASALLRGAASGQVYVTFGTQRSTVDHFGDRGGDVIANISANAAFRTKDAQDIGRLTGDYKLPPPSSSGEYYLASEGQILHLKAPYIQTTDPSKPRLHEGITIDKVSWARRDLVTGGLEESHGLHAAGAAYANRFTLVDDRMMAYLTHGDISVEVADGSPEKEAADPHAQGEVFERVKAELEAFAAANGLDLSKNDPEPQPPQAQQPSAEQKRPEAIIAILKQAYAQSTVGLSATEIAFALNDAGDTAAEPNVISSTLSRMFKQGLILRPSVGRYTPLIDQNQHTNPQQEG
jgi:hypothetical protein